MPTLPSIIQLGGVARLEAVLTGNRKEDASPNGLALVPRMPFHSVHIPAKVTSGSVSSMANHFGVFCGLNEDIGGIDFSGPRVHALSG